MKIKYFLRGLGIGILITTLLLYVGSTKSDSKTLTEEQIIEKARELGMMTEEEAKDYRLDQSLDNLKESITGEEKQKESTSHSPSSEAVKVPKGEKTSEKSEEISVSSDSNEKKGNTSKENQKEDNKEKKYITVSIKAGLISNSVAKSLEEQGAIDSAQNFTDYVIEKKLTTSIIAGNYKIPVGASYAEIIEIIT